MKHFLSICVIALSAFLSSAQTVIDNFTVGPFIVDYKGKGNINYRLRENTDLYEYFGLAKDTTIVTAVPTNPVTNAFAISGYVGANRFAAKEIGLEGVWKHALKSSLFFNAGLSLTVDYADFGSHGVHRGMLEIGVLLQIELGRLDRSTASLYGILGISPAVYTTLKATKWNGSTRVDDVSKTGFIVAPRLEFGGNIPVGSTIMRLGVYGVYKINCTAGDYNVYTIGGAGRMFLGAKIGVVL